MNSRLPITLLCAGAVALACGSLAKTEVAQTPARHETTAHAEPSATPSKVQSKFGVSVEPHALQFSLKLVNQGKKHLELEFPDGQPVEFSVQDSLGREVYRWGKGRMFTQSVQNRVIDGGDMMQFEESAPTTLPKGKYVAIATLRSSNVPVTERSQFELR